MSMQLGLNASATARAILKRLNDEDEISVSLVEETGVPAGYTFLIHRISVLSIIHSTLNTCNFLL